MGSREKEIRKYMEEYKQTLRKMTSAELGSEWNAVVLSLCPDSQIKERIESKVEE